jgi:nucleoside-diphosphate-sugar epimerase
MTRLLIFGLGFSGAAVARRALAAGMEVIATSRNPAACTAPSGTRMLAFDQAGPAVAEATHMLVTAPPGEAGDPVLRHYDGQIRAAGGLSWIGYLSTTGVYGDRQGGWVDETTAPAPAAERSVRRVAAEEAWRAAAGARSLDIFRLAGIYGPGRSALNDARAGRVRRIHQPGHAFGRIHVEDIAGGVLAAIAKPAAGTRVLNFADDEPAESAAVAEEAARLLGTTLPPAVSLAEAWPTMGEMARGFWSENRRVASAITQKELDYRWAYPNYRVGLQAILEQERADQAT